MMPIIVTRNDFAPTTTMLLGSSEKYTVDQSFNAIYHGINTLFGGVEFVECPWRSELPNDNVRFFQAPLDSNHGSILSVAFYP